MLEKNVYSTAVRWNVQQMSFRSIFWMMSLKASVYLLISVVLPIIKSGVFKSPTIIVELYTSTFNYVIFWFMYFGTFVWCTCVLKSYSFLMHNLFSPSIYFQTICIFDSKLYSLWDDKNFSFYSGWQFLPFVWLCNPFTFNVIIDRSRCDISYLYYYFSHDFLCL